MVDKPYTLNEAAEMLNISPQTLRREIDRGKIAAYRFGGRYFIRKSDLLDYIKRSIYKPNAPHRAIEYDGPSADESMPSLKEIRHTPTQG